MKVVGTEEVAAPNLNRHTLVPPMLEEGRRDPLTLESEAVWVDCDFRTSADHVDPHLCSSLICKRPKVGQLDKCAESELGYEGAFDHRFARHRRIVKEWLLYD
jgi:hypothetical protein